MIVTALLDFGKDRKKVYLDGQPAFVLYRGELSACHIEEGEELPEEMRQRILEEILWKRIRQRCLYLLKSMDRTEYQVEQKLKEACYPEELVKRALAWLRELHYVDDARYAEHYVRCHGEQKGRNLLFRELLQKGVDRDLIVQALDAKEGPTEEELILRWVEKKNVDPATASQKEWNRLYGFLMRKGFSAAAIANVLKKNLYFE